MMTHQLHDIPERGKNQLRSSGLRRRRSTAGLATATQPADELTGKTKTTRFRSDVDLGSGSAGEVERELAIPIIKRLRPVLPPDRVGRPNRDDNWWVVKRHDPEQWRHGASAYRLAFTTTGAGRTATWRCELRTSGKSPVLPQEVSVDEFDARARRRARRCGDSFLILTWSGR